MSDYAERVDAYHADSARSVAECVICHEPGKVLLSWRAGVISAHGLCYCAECGNKLKLAFHKERTKFECTALTPELIEARTAWHKSKYPMEHRSTVTWVA